MAAFLREEEVHGGEDQLEKDDRHDEEVGR